MNNVNTYYKNRFKNIKKEHSMLYTEKRYLEENLNKLRVEHKGKKVIAIIGQECIGSFDSFNNAYLETVQYQHPKIDKAVLIARLEDGYFYEGECVQISGANVDDVNEKLATFSAKCNDMRRDFSMEFLKSLFVERRRNVDKYPYLINKCKELGLNEAQTSEIVHTIVNLYKDCYDEFPVRMLERE